MSIICVTVAYGAPDLLRRAVESALAAGVDEVHVWDNSESGEASALFGTAAAVHVYGDGRNWGFGGGVNRAVGLADLRVGDHVLLLNPDAEIDVDSLRLLTAEIESAPGIVGPRMKYPDGSFGIAGGPRPSLVKEVLATLKLDDRLPSSVRSRILRLFRSKGSGSLGATLVPGPPISVDWVSGFCMLVSCEAFNAVSGFDESFFLYFEDVDFCLRARSAGYPCRLVRSAVAGHRESATTSVAKGRHYAQGRAQFFALHGTPWERGISRLLRRL